MVNIETYFALPLILRPLLPIFSFLTNDVLPKTYIDAHKSIPSPLYYIFSGVYYGQFWSRQATDHNYSVPINTCVSIRSEI